MIIVSRVSSFVLTAFKGAVASIGNLVAEGDKNIIKKVFNEYNALFFLISGIICICLLFLTKPFIILWIGTKYLLSDVTFLIILINVYFGIIRIAVGFFLDGYVLYKDTWAPIAEASTNLVISLFGGYFWGITGVLLGTTISLLIFVILWKPYFLFKEGFSESVKQYWMIVTKYVVLLLITLICIYLLIYWNVFLDYANFFNFAINGTILLGTTSIIYWALMYAFDQGTKDISRRVVYLIKSRYGY